MFPVVRLSMLALLFAFSLMLAGASGALALDPPDRSPQDVCWSPADFPGVGANTSTGNGQAWNGHFHSDPVTNAPCS